MTKHDGLWYMECPCCGDDGAVSDEAGLFCDGQTLICGCNGWVSVSADDTEPYICIGDDPCPPYTKCNEMKFE